MSYFIQLVRSSKSLSKKHCVLQVETNHQQIGKTELTTKINIYSLLQVSKIKHTIYGYFNSTERTAIKIYSKKL
jgi:hypothetical protein